MEKQDLDNLQQATKDYSMSASWFEGIILGVIFIVFGLMTYFKISNWNTLGLLLFPIMLVLYFVSRRIKRNIMSKGLGYVRQKGETISLKNELFRKMVLIGVIAGIIVGVLGFFIKVENWNIGWDDEINAPLLLLGVGLSVMVVGLRYRKRTVFRSTFYGGVFLIACALILIFPSRHILYAHKEASMGITMTLAGIGMILVSIIRCFEYKNLVEKIKGTT